MQFWLALCRTRQKIGLDWILLYLLLFRSQDSILCTHLNIELILNLPFLHGCPQCVLAPIFIRAWSGLLSVGFGLCRFFWTQFFVMIYVTKISTTPNLWTEDICFSLCKYDFRQIGLGWHHFSCCNWVILTVSAQLLCVKQILNIHVLS